MGRARPGWADEEAGTPGPGRSGTRPDGEDEDDDDDEDRDDDGGGGGRVTAPAEPGDGAAPEATLALAAVTVAVAVGMGRLFAGASYLVPLVGAAVVGHAAMWAGRRSSLPLAVSALAAMAGVGLGAAWLLFPETTTLGLVPGPATLAAARDALAASWSQFADVVAPAPSSDGFLLAAMVGVGVTAVLADWAAFRMKVLFEAVVPSFTLFVFTATLGDERRRGLMVALYLATLLLFLVVHRAGLESRETTWFASRARGGPGALVQGAAVLALVAIAAAVIVGPRLPGASADALLAWRDTDGPGGSGRRTTISPLVDIRGRLVDQSDTEVFTVKASQRAYWRLTSLDTFDGNIWSSDASYRPVDEHLPAPEAGTAGAPEETIVQEFTIRSLSSIWLPAAYRPERVAGIEDLSWNDDLGSLITGEDTTNGLTYRVESSVPRLNGTDLLGSPRRVPSPDLARFLDLPPLSDAVRQLAGRLSELGGTTPYTRGLAIQNHLREGFVYDLGARPGHDGRALEEFLFETRRGYCEQFAGAFAVLAREMGLPTRVAVGFTPGEPGGDGLLHVRGLNAHAWPEVFIENFGWVAFEPTPGRGAPGADAYLGVPEAQARPQDPTTATTAGAPTTVAPEDTATPSTTAAPTEEQVDAGDAEQARPLRRHPLVVAALAALLVTGAGAGAVPVAKAVRRRRRRAAAADPAERVWVAWREAAEAVARAGAPRRPAETLDEHARRAGPAAALPASAASALATLARDAETASYAPGPLPAEAAEAAAANAATVERTVTAMATRRRRAAWLLDPRPLFGSGPGADDGRPRRR